ncbi:SPOR domain-containing protein [Amylibacter sp. IMCC11727]|uniref:SPOR domain-containing protein n=1 Tax=Amylibacter sp. IMCC11727 TaxID=3039851 RepID=UPI00244DBDA4|nr:SPOR domain-containing protein [Amylibacter sp. IMCC11727]WGI20745.1 SPOR domain-containing protein [Amylibacter sp. IMCC11727]
MAKAQTESVENPAASGGGFGVVKTAINWGVAALSLAVIAGFVFWTVNLGTRDPHDVPIVRAMEGPSRVAPEDPGGTQASHQGLAVNSVQSEGGVANPSNTVVLAPEPAQLTDEDQPINTATQVTQVATQPVEQSVADPEPEVAQSEEDLDAIEIADQVAERLAQEALANIDPATIPRENIRGTEFSPSASLRPQVRPAGLSTEITLVQPTASNSAVQNNVAAVDSVPIGTRLIQLGAYDSADLANSEWAKLLAKHSHLLEDKKRLVVAAQSGGRKFYRLRAAGFNSLDESRALCSALLAVGTPCIPVTAR